jgi:hypothetical protein
MCECIKFAQPVANEKPEGDLQRAEDVADLDSQLVIELVDRDDVVKLGSVLEVI